MHKHRPYTIMIFNRVSFWQTGNSITGDKSCNWNYGYFWLEYNVYIMYFSVITQQTTSWRMPLCFVYEFRTETDM